MCFALGNRSYTIIKAVGIVARVFIWLTRLFGAAFGLIVLAFALTYWFASRSLPDYSADYEISGLSAPVEIVRDNANVPHIFGSNDADVYFGLGFVHAQDRLWQMLMLRQTAQGRLSEMFGERTVKIDDLVRRLDLYNLASTSVEQQDEKTRTMLASYAKGVNAWLSKVNEQALGRGAPELFLFSSSLSPWQPADSIAIGKLMALQMSSHLEREVTRAQASLVLEQPRLMDLLADVPGEGKTELGDFASLFNGAKFPNQYAELPRDPLHPVKRRAFAGASNAWAVTPDRSATRSTLLANDPHLGLSAPTVWYLARLQLASGGVIGGSFPGAPIILAGRSSKLGWGPTTANVDDQDLFIEQLNPENPQEYRTPDGFRTFRTQQSVIRIKDAAPITITMRWTENGPVLPGQHFNLAAITPPGHVVSLGFTALNEIDTTMTGWRRLMEAHSIKDALQAGRWFSVAPQNLTLADRHSVGMMTVGALPRRDPAHQSQGRIPAPGWIKENRWNGMYSFSFNPQIINPVGGGVATTNNKYIDRPFPEHISFTWGDTQRIVRLRKLLQDRKVHTRDSFIEAQLDTVSNAARSLLPLVARDLWFSGDAAPAGTPAHQRQIALNLLAKWNGQMNEHLPEPLIYAAWMNALQNRLTRDELGPLSDTFKRPNPLFIERVYRNTDGAAVWCDVIQTSPVETCLDVARQSLDQALLDMTEQYGRNIESWRWGDAHVAMHDHQVLGEVPILGWFVNIRQSTSGGDHTLQRGRTSGKVGMPFANVHAAGYRGVYDFADPDSSVFVTATGQSGHPLSRFYENMGELWRRGEYIPMSLDPALARAASVGITMLTPMQ